MVNKKQKRKTTARFKPKKAQKDGQKWSKKQKTKSGQIWTKKKQKAQKDGQIWSKMQKAQKDAPEFRDSLGEETNAGHPYFTRAASTGRPREVGVSRICLFA